MGLLILASQSVSVTKVGGFPKRVAEFEWPSCSECENAMQFIAQFRLAECKIDGPNKFAAHLLIFQCQNDPGMCDDWDANSGGNAAIIVPDGNAVISDPKNGVTTLSEETYVELKSYEPAGGGETSDDNYVAAVEDALVLGKIGGNPVWVQGDETPDCDCGSQMQFFAQLEERGGGGINFGGGGAGFVFVCSNCDDKAKFLWQS